MNAKRSIAALLALACMHLHTGMAQTPWWNHAVFYEVFVRSYYDSNGDGVGDIRGLTSKLDYLNDGDSSTASDLGVSGIWLMPIFPSPSYHGYDVTDYRTIKQQYGMLSDFKALVDSAHARGIKVILDLVMNHTSSQHPWFVQSASNASSPFRDWYTWSATDPGYSGPWGQRVWHLRNGAYYFGLFSSGMPDLNYANPDVKAAMFDVTRFWLDSIKVDGFRLDAIKHLFESGQMMENAPATFTFLREFRQFYKGVNSEAVAVGEVWSETDQIARYVDGTGIDFCFEFPLATAIIDAVRYNQPGRVQNQMKLIINRYPALQYAPFLANHDQDRVFEQLSNNIDQMKLAAAIYLTLPGVPFVYYGEEIGMTGSGRDENKRTPMQWNGSANAGFTTGRPWMSVNPTYPAYNVQIQQSDTSSVWSWYRTMIAARNAAVSLRVGDYAGLSSTEPNLLGYARRTPSEVVLVLHNLLGSPAINPDLTLDGSPLPAGVYDVSNVLSGNLVGRLTLNSNGGFTGWNAGVALSPRGTTLLKIDAAKRRPRYAISGIVRSADGSGIDGATIEVAGYGSATTDGTGTYLIPNVDEGLRTITASLDESLLDPIARTVTLTSDLTSQDFVAVPTGRIATVTFDVAVPITTPPESTVYLAGSFNSWDPGPGQAGRTGTEYDIALMPAGFHHHRVTLRFERGDSVEYRYTRGSWSDEETLPQHVPRPNRTMVIPFGVRVVYDTVLAWADAGVTSIATHGQSDLPAGFVLHQNYPNPFNPTTVIRFEIPGTRGQGLGISDVRLVVYDLLGREVATLVNEEMTPGSYTVMFSARGGSPPDIEDQRGRTGTSGLASGVYMYRLTAGEHVASRKMLLTK